MVTHAYRLPSLYWEVAKVLRGYGVPNVNQDSFSAFQPQLLPAKPWSSEWWAWRKIPPRYYEDGEQLSRQMEPRHDGRLLLDALAWYPQGKITRSSKKHTLLTVYGTMNCLIVSSKYIDSISVLYLSCFICYKLLQLLKYPHIFSVYTKTRLFKSQKTRGDRERIIYKFEFSTSKLTKNTYPHSCLILKNYFCKAV